MELIDQAYRTQLEQLHRAGKFNNGASAYKIVEQFIKQYQPATVLDFGCGHGALINTIKLAHPEISVAGYDPGNRKFCQLPTVPFDAVVSTDALEHVEYTHLDQTLAAIHDLVGHCGFFRIACYPAKKHLPDGRNAHLIVESPDWWRQKIISVMKVNIVFETITAVDKTHKWPQVKGHNYDVVVVK